MIERPNSPQAKVFNTTAGLKIEIPSKKNWFIIVFLTAWLGGWLLGELFALSSVFGNIYSSIFSVIDQYNGEDKGFIAIESFFILFWLIGWSIGGFFAIRVWLWMIVGKEILTFEMNELKVENKGTFFITPKTYDLSKVKDFQLNPVSNNNFSGYNLGNIWSFRNDGVLKFDYGFKTIRIASGIDEAEGKYLLDIIKSRNFIK